jgi:molybdopterin synthase catalytic subunit
MKVDIRLFAVFRERAGRERLELELDDDATVADALSSLQDEPGLGELLAKMPVRVALNREYVSEEAAIGPDDELALIPPVSGGATGAATGPRIAVRVTDEPLSLEAVSAAVADPAAGAIVSFQGTTREVERLEYEAYSEMAEERIEAIARECAERHGLIAVAAEHRVGSVALGEPSVIVAASSGHRPEAFAGAREAIDRIKAEAPIWKKEIDGGSERWADGEAP